MVFLGILFCFLVFSGFILIRSIIAGYWNEGLCDIALGIGGPTPWHAEWDIVDAIINPLHYSKWTTKQWAKYLIKEE
jgi:hypothetical protein